MSGAAGERLLVPGRAGSQRGVRPGARRRHHRGGGRRRERGERPEHPGGALPRAGAGGLLLPQTDHMSSQLVHSHGVQPISF